MKRRSFLKAGAAVTAAAILDQKLFADSPKASQSEKALINAYYFRAHMYTMVPKQVREDLQWMADLGTNIVSIAVLEQDMFAAVENIEIVCKEAERLGISVFMVPSRWGGLVAGAPKVPSIFTVQNPQTWVLERNGKPLLSDVTGVQSSVHYPEVYDFFCRSIDKAISLWDIKGIIWDEPESFLFDYSPLAIKNLGEDAPLSKHIQSTCDFYSRVNQYIKSKYSQIITNLFSFGGNDDDMVDRIARIKFLDYVGCDGRPWRAEDQGVLERKGKLLLGADAGERYLSAARKNNTKSLMLIENHNMRTKDNHLMDKRLSEVLELNADQYIYYYFPRNLEKPYENMDIIKKHFQKYLNS